MDQQQCDNMYISIFSQHNYIYSVCYNTTYFGPLCGPSSGACIGSVIQLRGGGRGGEILLCNALGNISILPS